MDIRETRQELFNHLAEEHDLIILESQLDDIINIVSSENDAVKALVDDLNLILEDIRQKQLFVESSENNTNENRYRYDERRKIQHQIIMALSKYSIANEK